MAERSRPSRAPESHKNKNKWRSLCTVPRVRCDFHWIFIAYYFTRNVTAFQWSPHTHDWVIRRGRKLFVIDANAHVCMSISFFIFFWRTWKADLESGRRRYFLLLYYILLHIKQRNCLKAYIFHIINLYLRSPPLLFEVFGFSFWNGVEWVWMAPETVAFNATITQFYVI